MPEPDTIQLSIIAPVFNERENIEPLCARLDEELGAFGLPYEIILVDDGSTDGSVKVLREIAKRPNYRVILFRRNFGQTSAIRAGFDHARGQILIPIDADLQNDPADIPKLVAKLEEGYDVVSGWRHNRKDTWLTRKLPSILANGIISRVTGVALHDYGCTLKAYRREVLQDAVLYGEMHRFIPVYAAWAGAAVTELKVNHLPRTAGISKYGLGRTIKVLLDLLTVKFFSSYLTKPTYFFGRYGLMSMLAALFVAALMVVDKLWWNVIQEHRQTGLLFAMMLFLLGGQSIMLGVLAEIEVRTYFESQDKRPYLVREIVSADDSN